MQLDDVPLRVRRVDPGDSPAVPGLHGDDLAEPGATGSDHGIHGGRHVRHLERDVAPARSIDPTARVLVERVVLEDLERRTALAVPRQSQVGARQMGITQAGRGVQVGAPDVALRRDELAAEDVRVERRQSPPVVAP